MNDSRWDWRVRLGAWSACGIVALSLAVACRGLAEPATGVHVSNDDPHWGDTITVTYEAPDTSVYAGPAFRDTAFCAAILNTAQGERGIVVPMQRPSVASYSAAFRVPDSTYSIRIEICIPADRLPDGIAEFTCRMPGGKAAPGGVFAVSANVDSALAIEIANYPRRYAAYVTAIDYKRQLGAQNGVSLSSSEVHDYITAQLAALERRRDTVPAWYIAVAMCHGQLKGEDAQALAALDSAASHVAFDPLFNEPWFWNRFFSPAFVNGAMVMPYAAGRAIAPLVRAFPRTEMGKMWLDRMGGDSLLDGTLYAEVSKAWASTWDVDLLMSVAYARGNRRTRMYDPASALRWISRAEESYRTGAGFYSGENIYGGMDRFARLIAQKVELLTVLGRTGEAVTLARGSLRAVHRPQDKEAVGVALGNAYVAGADFAAAERAYGAAISSSSRRKIDGLDTLYQHNKRDGESKQDYTKRITAAYGNLVELPQLKDFTYTTLDGARGSLHALRGKLVVLDFWFINCPGCVLEHESMNRLVDAFRGDSAIVFLSVALDGEARLREYVRGSPTRFPIVPNGRATCDALGVEGFPTHIVLNRDGSTATWEFGGSATAGEQLRDRLVELRGKP